LAQTDPIAEAAAPAGAAPPSSGARERGRARRRLRYLRRLRELQLRDLGGLVFDLYRFGEQREQLVRAKLDRIIATDKEIRALEVAMEERGRPREVRQPGVGGACAGCGELHSTYARFCSGCGRELSGPPQPAPHAPPDDPEVTAVIWPGHGLPGGEPEGGSRPSAEAAAEGEEAVTAGGGAVERARREP
jgi:hypothetical protein